MTQLHQQIRAVSTVGAILLTFPFNPIEGASEWTGGTGDWTNPANWTSGLPSTLAVIENGGTPVLTPPGTIFLEELEVGRFGTAGGSVDIDGGDLRTSSIARIGGAGGGQVTVRNGGNFSAQSTLNLGLDTGTGELNLLGNGTTAESLSLDIGGFGGTGSLFLSEGAEFVTSETTMGITDNGLGLPSATATVTGSGSTWANSGVMIIGDEGDGILSVVNGGEVSSGSIRIAEGSVESTGEVSVEGADSALSTRGGITVAGEGEGSLFIGDGALVETGFFNGSSSFIALRSDSIGSVTVEGLSEWRHTGGLEVGFSGTGTLDIQDGGGVRLFSDISGFDLGELVLGQTETGHGTVTVDGAGSSLTMSESLVVGSDGTGILQIRNGGRVQNWLGIIGSGPFSTGTVSVAGSESLWEITTTLILGEEGFGQLNLTGGTVEFDALEIGSGGSANWTFGTIRDTSDWSIDQDTLFALLGFGGGSQGGAPALGLGQTLDTDGTATLNTQLVIDGGTFEAGNVENAFLLDLQRGTFNLTEADLEVESGGLLGADLAVESGQTIQVTNEVAVGSGGELEMRGGYFSGGTVTNDGVISGDGEIGGGVINNADGEIRSSGGGNLHFTGATFNNSGQVEAIGTPENPAEIEFDGAMTNQAGTGLITGRNAKVRFDSGLDNQGSLVLSTGTSDVFGDIDNTGTLLVTGGAQVTFYDDITQNGTLEVAASGDTVSVATFLGEVSGSGGATGGGDIFLDGDVRPGNSPGVLSYENHLVFGANSVIEFEIGGLEPGTEYDQIINIGVIELRGLVSVLLTEDFDPQLNDSFDLLSSSMFVDNGFEFESPSLAGGLSFSPEILEDLGGGSSVLQVTVVPEPANAAVMFALPVGIYVLARRKPRRN